MDDMHNPFKLQIEALKQGRFSFVTAEIVVDNLKAKVASGVLDWKKLGTSPGELEIILLKLQHKQDKSPEEAK